MSVDSQDRQRVFLALWPPQEARQQLVSLAERCAGACGGRPQRVENIHLTLAFLGELGVAQLNAVRGIAGATDFTPFRLRLDRVSGFKRNGILWAGCREEPPALLRLVADLANGLRRSGFRVDERPYRVHLTLLRRVRRFPRLTMEPLEWDVEEFCLVRSELTAAGAQYRIMEYWPRRESVVQGGTAVC